ncbi:MAG: hypothetical protein ACN0LA_09770 [Candidatus Longimicrobiales bacterium M2_2A_002]
MKRNGPSTAWKILGGLLLGGAVGAVVAVLAVHEAGHLLAGRLVGFRFLLFIVGPLRVAREGDRVQVGWNRSLSLAGWLAATGPTPDRLERLRRRTAIMVAGGPLTSLAAGAGGAPSCWPRDRPRRR